MAILWKVKTEENGVIGERICIKDEILIGGESSICKEVNIDSDIDVEGICVVDAFSGSIKKATCPKCIENLNYYKKLR